MKPSRAIGTSAFKPMTAPVRIPHERSRFGVIRRTTTGKKKLGPKGGRRKM